MSEERRMTPEGAKKLGTEVSRVCSITYDGDLVPASIRNGRGSMFRSPQYKAFRKTMEELYIGTGVISRNDRLFKLEINMRQNCTGTKRKFYRGDIDNITKPIMDSATGIIWADDSQVVELHSKLDRNALDSGFEAIIYDIGDWHNYRQDVACANCGKKFEKLISHVKLSTLHFCSRACWTNYRRVEKQCLSCGKSFSHGKKAERGTQFCSPKCYGEYMHNNPEKYPNLLANLGEQRLLPRDRNSKGQFTNAKTKRKA